MTFRKSALALCLLGLLCAVLPNGGQAAGLDIIEKRGRLIVGVKADYPPWGMVGEDGTLVGFEADLAADLARRLGVDLELTAVSSGNRLQKLEDGSVDLVIATMGDTTARRRISGLLEPNYYASGVTLLVPKEVTVTDWQELHGRPVCLTEGAYFNRDVIERFVLDPVILKGTRDSALALENGRCIGWAYDDTALIRFQKSDPRWADYHMPLASALTAPWAVAVAKSAKGGPLGRFVSDTIVDWHRSGFLIEKERDWGIPPSRFLAEQRDLWTKKDGQGNYVCRRIDGRFPIGCLDKKLAGGSGRESEIFGDGVVLWLVQNGIDFPPLYDDFSRKHMLWGGAITILLAVASILGSLVFAAVFSGLYVISARPFRLMIDLIGAVFRMTPPILNLYLVFFGIGSYLAYNFGLTLDAFFVAAFVFSLYAGAGNLFVFVHAYKHVVDKDPDSPLQHQLSLALEGSYGGIEAISVNIVKAVAMASVIAVPELVTSTNAVIAEFGSTGEMMLFLMLYYFLIVFAFIRGLKFLSNRVHSWSRPIA